MKELTYTLTIQQPGTLSAPEVEQRSQRLQSGLETLAQQAGGGTVRRGTDRPTTYTGLVVADPQRTQTFYTEHLGCTSLFDTDGYAHVRHDATGLELAFLQSQSPNPFPEMAQPNQGQGVWIGIEVPNADAEYERLKACGVTIREAPKDQPWGERTIVIQDPDGHLIYLGHPIPSPALAESTPA